MINRFKRFVSDDKLSTLLLAALSVVMLMAYLLAAFRSYVNADAGYYLGVAELIHQGYVPYRDFCLNYTPLLFYALQIPRMFMGNYPDYSGYMLFLYIIVFIDAVLTALIVKEITKKVKLAWLSGLLFLVMYYYFEGAYFLLEAFSVCFGLASIFTLLKGKGGFWCMLLAGAFSAFSFLSKQYGLLFAGVIGVASLFSDDLWKKKLWNCISAMLGFCAVISVFFLLFFIAGLKPDELIEVLSGSGYGGQSIKMYVEGVIRSVRLFPFLLFIPCLFFDKKENDLSLIMGCMAGLFMASLQFYFNVFSHYYIFMIPFVLVLSVLLWKRLNHKKLSRMWSLLCFGFMFVSIAIPMQEIYKSSKTLIKHNLRDPQIQTANQIRQIVNTYDCKSALSYWNTIQYYGLCPLKPSMMKEYGFSFGYDTEETYCERLMGADCFVVEKKEMKDIEKMEHFSQVLHEDFPVVEMVPQSDVLVFIRDK